MKNRIPALIPAIPLALACAAPMAGAKTISELKDHRRVLIIAAPDQNDPQAVVQRRILGQWGQGAADRDISVVEIAGGRVTGASGDATGLRRRYAIVPARFDVVLIGKDGHVALRSGHPVSADTLQRTIDAMPMRRAGGR